MTDKMNKYCYFKFQSMNSLKQVGSIVSLNENVIIGSDIDHHFYLHINDKLQN